MTDAIDRMLAAAAKRSSEGAEAMMTAALLSLTPDDHVAALRAIGYRVTPPQPDDHPFYIKAERTLPCPGCDRFFGTPFALIQHRSSKGH
jgi:hypothetical protein